MILCSGLDMTVLVCVYVRERERDTHKMYIDTENTQANVFHKGERLNYLQGGKRVLYIVTLSLH